MRHSHPPLLALNLLALSLPSFAVAQTHHATHGGMSGSSVTLAIDESAREFIVTVGPVDLPAGGEDHDGAHGGVYPPIGTVTIPFEAFITSFRYEMVDEHGRVLPNDVLHHVNLNDPHHRELFLPISRRFLAASMETGPQSAPGWLVGLPLTEGDQLVVSAMFHNPTGRDLDGVSLHFVMGYRLEAGFGPLFRVYPFHIDVAFPAGHKAFSVPPGRHTWSWEGSPSIPGRIMGIGSHMHDYIENITLTDLRSGKELWEGCPIFDDGGKLTGMTVGRQYRTLGTKIYPDRKYRVAVTYNNPTGDTLIDGGMGVVAGLFSPARNTVWPIVDRDDPLYEIDRQHYMREVEGKWEDLVAAVPGGNQLPAIRGTPTTGDPGCQG